MKISHNQFIRSTMITTLLILLPLITFSAAHPLCNCGLGSGEDVCHHRHRGQCSPLVVRPVEVPKPELPKAKIVCAPVGDEPDLSPIGGPCDCHTSLVKPAVVPKPPCLACGGSIDLTNDHHLTLSQKQQILFGGISGYQTAAARPVIVDDVDRSRVNPANYVAADPVSLHVAYKLAQEPCYHNEDRLAFGFRSLPKELPLYIKRGVTIPEENLFNLNGQIVELKKKKCNTKSLDDEATEQLIQLAEEEEDEKLNLGSAANIKHISLGEIGYAPAKIKEPDFINVKPGLLSLDDGLSVAVKNCNDGFKPGNVLIEQIPKEESLALPPVLPDPCPPEEEPFIPAPPAIPPGAVFSNPYTYFSSGSSSSASRSNSYKKSVFLQKLSCN